MKQYLAQLMYAIHQDPFRSKASRNVLRKRFVALNARMVGSPFILAENIAYTGDLVTASSRFTSLLDIT